MGLFSDLISATVKTALAPVAIAKDVVNVVVGEEPDTTKELLESAGDDVSDAIDKLIEGL